MQIDKDKLKQIIFDLLKISKEMSDETGEYFNLNFVSYNTIFEQACMFYRQSLIPNQQGSYSKLDTNFLLPVDKSQDVKGNKFAYSSKGSPSSVMKPATQKQINFLKELNYKEDASKLTSKEASKVIEYLTNKLNLKKDKI